MPLSAQFQNEILYVITKAQQVLDLRYELELLRARWNQNDMFNLLTDADIEAIPSFKHPSKAEVSNAINAFNAVLDALGDNSSGQAVNLIKLKG